MDVYDIDEKLSEYGVDLGLLAQFNKIYLADGKTPYYHPEHLQRLLRAAYLIGSFQPGAGDPTARYGPGRSVANEYLKEHLAEPDVIPGWPPSGWVFKEA